MVRNKKDTGKRFCVFLNEREQDTIKAMKVKGQSDSEFIKQSIQYRVPIPEGLLRWKINQEEMFDKVTMYGFEKRNGEYCKGADDAIALIVKNKKKEELENVNQGYA